MFSFHWIDILFTSVTFYTHLASVVFLSDLAFNDLMSYLVYNQ